MKRPLPLPTELSIERDEIHRLFVLNGWYCLKTDVLKNVKIEYERNGKTSVRRFTDYSAEEGRADLLAMRMWAGEELQRNARLKKPLTPMGVGEALFIEVKRPGQKSKPHQKAWKECMEKRGYVVLSDCRSWSDVVTKAREYGIQVTRER